MQLTVEKLSLWWHFLKHNLLWFSEVHVLWSNVVSVYWVERFSKWYFSQGVQNRPHNCLSLWLWFLVIDCDIISVDIGTFANGVENWFCCWNNDSPITSVIDLDVDEENPVNSFILEELSNIMYYRYTEWLDDISGNGRREEKYLKIEVLELVMMLSSPRNFLYNFPLDRRPWYYTIL